MSGRDEVVLSPPRRVNIGTRVAALETMVAPSLGLWAPTKGQRDKQLYPLSFKEDRVIGPHTVAYYKNPPSLLSLNTSCF